MKRGTIDHPKTIRLAKILGLQRWGAVGILESLWHFCAKRARRGDIGRWTDEEICSAVGWKDDSEKLVSALVDAKWLDKCNAHRLLVHDWEIHCDETVKKTIRNHSETFARIPEKKRKKVPAIAIAKAIAINGEQADEPPDSPDLVLEIPECLESHGFRASWASWEQHRRENKKKLTPLSTKRLLAKLESWGQARSIAAIEHSIEHGYQGIFEPRVAHGQNSVPAAAPDYGRLRKEWRP